MGEISIAGFICERCTHKWTPRLTKKVKSHSNLPIVCPKCLPPDSIICGDFKEISQYTKGNLSFGFSGLKSNVTEIFRHDFEGNLLEINSQGCLPLRVTPEHKVLAIHSIQKSRSSKRKFSRNFLEPDWIEGKNLKIRPRSENINSCGDYLVIPKTKGDLSENKIGLSEFSSLHGLKSLLGRKKKEYFLLNNDSAWILGLYVAEGWSSGGKGEIKLCLGKHEKDLIKEAENKIRKMGYKVNSVEKETAIEVTFYSRILGRAFKSWCGVNAHTKRIPEFIIRHKNDDFIKSFLKGYLVGDGFIRKNEGRTQVIASTVSKVLALQLQLLSVRLNSFFSISMLDFSKYPSIAADGHIINGGIAYRLISSAGPITNLMGEKALPRHNKSYKIFDNYIGIPINSIKLVPYKGPVMNLETEEGNYVCQNLVVKNCKSPYWNIKRGGK